MEIIQNLPKPQPNKSNFCKSDFDIPKYAQIEKVFVFRNMLRYEHMDKYGIGTDCKGKGLDEKSKKKSTGIWFPVCLNWNWMAFIVQAKNTCTKGWYGF